MVNAVDLHTTVLHGVASVLSFVDPLAGLMHVNKALSDQSESRGVSRYLSLLRLRRCCAGRLDAGKDGACEVYFGFSAAVNMRGDREAKRLMGEKANARLAQ